MLSRPVDLLLAAELVGDHDQVRGRGVQAVRLRARRSPQRMGGGVEAGRGTDRRGVGCQWGQLAGADALHRRRGG